MLLTLSLGQGLCHWDLGLCHWDWDCVIHWDLECAIQGFDLLPDYCVIGIWNVPFRGFGCLLVTYVVTYVPFCLLVTYVIGI